MCSCNYFYFVDVPTAPEEKLVGGPRGAQPPYLQLLLFLSRSSWAHIVLSLGFGGFTYDVVLKGSLRAHLRFTHDRPLAQSLVVLHARPAAHPYSAQLGSVAGSRYGSTADAKEDVATLSIDLGARPTHSKSPVAVQMHVWLMLALTGLYSI